MTSQFNFLKVVNPTILTEEIRNSSIKISLDYINTSYINSDMNVTIVFKEVLTDDEAIILSNIVNNHVFKEDIAEVQKVTIADVTTTKTEKAILVATTTPEGSQVFLTSHNLCDKTTWYTKSIRKTEVLSKVADKTFKSTFPYWIDLEHGKVPYEERINTPYKEVVKKNGVQISDYIIDYVKGEVTLSEYNNEEITAEYNYSTSSEWYIQPIANKIFKLEGTSVTLSADLEIPNDNGIIFQLMVGDQNYGAPTIYNNMDDLFECSTTSQQPFTISGFSRTKLNFEYRTSKDLDSRLNTKICIKLKNESMPLNGTRATIVAYGKSVEVL